MSASAPRRQRTGEAAPWPWATGALIAIGAIALISCYGALRLSQTLTGHARPPWVLLGPTLLVLVHGAAVVADSLSCSGRTTPLLAALYTLYILCFGYGLYQALAVYGPGLAHTAARLL